MRVTAVDVENTVANASASAAFKGNRASRTRYFARSAIGLSFVVAALVGVAQTYCARCVQIRTVKWWGIDKDLTFLTILAAIAHIQIADIGVIVFCPVVDVHERIAPLTRIVTLVLVRFVASIVDKAESR